jgi:ABC-2 type transport system ATP-binding protein
VTVIDVRGLTKRYGPFEAVAGVSFSVQRGEIVGFLGPNGAGKTTTLRILTGFMPATGGTAIVAGHDVHREPLEVKRNVGYLPENVPLYPEMRVRSYLQYVAEVKSVARASRAAEVARVIERCGLGEMRDRLIGHLSKGYKQRVGLAQALVGNPPVLILDEPTVGLDPKQIISIRETIRELAAEHTVLVSTHILPEVAMLCRRVVILNRGRIAAEQDLAQMAPGRSLEDLFLAAISADGATAA